VAILSHACLKGDFMPHGNQQKQEKQHGPTSPLLTLACLLARQAAAEHFAASETASPPSSLEPSEEGDKDHGD
jgi:hypothetical protein